MLHKLRCMAQETVQSRIAINIFLKGALPCDIICLSNRHEDLID